MTSTFKKQKKRTNQSYLLFLEEDGGKGSCRKGAKKTERRHKRVGESLAPEGHGGGRGGVEWHQKGAVSYDAYPTLDEATFGRYSITKCQINTEKTGNVST